MTTLSRRSRRRSGGRGRVEVVVEVVVVVMSQAGVGGPVRSGVPLSGREVRCCLG